MSRGNGSLLALVAIVAIVGPCRVGSAEPTAPAPGGMVIYRDPVTGALGAPPAAVAAQLGGQSGGRRRGMVERPGLSPAGGTILEGIPLMGMTATVDPAGKASAHCGPTLGQE